MTTTIETTAPTAQTADEHEHAEPLADEGFTVKDEDSAAWAVNVVLSYDEQIHRTKVQYERMMDRLEKERQRARDYFLPMLRAFYESNPPRKGRTLHLVTGDLKMRTVPGGIRIDDEAAIRVWAEAHLPEAFREQFRQRAAERAERDRVALEVAAAKAVASEHLEKTGEIPDGYRIVDASETFEVKAIKKGGA
jgi:hypothetical protein